MIRVPLQRGMPLAEGGLEAVLCLSREISSSQVVPHTRGLAVSFDSWGPVDGNSLIPGSVGH